MSRRGWWGLILAGGAGVRLRALTRAITGEGVPKQFCALLGRETFLDQARRRAALAIPRSRTLLVLTRTHEHFYRPVIEDIPRIAPSSSRKTAGPRRRSLYGLLRIATVTPMASVAIFPADHYVSDDATFMSHVTAAFSAVHARPDLAVLLGIEAESAETDYGWIESGEAIPETPLFRVWRFVEKPSKAAAQILLERGGLWNSFVMIGRVPAFLASIRRAAPDLDAAFASPTTALGTPAESGVMERVYSQLAPLSFSSRMACRAPRESGGASGEGSSVERLGRARACHGPPSPGSASPPHGRNGLRRDRRDRMSR